MKRFVVALGFLLAAIPAVAAQIGVSMVDFAFSPESVNISPGDTVKWTNNGSFAHTSTSGMNGVPDGRWNSGDVSPGGNYSRTFDSSGAFHYFCMHHYFDGMTGVVVVGSGTSVGEFGNLAVGQPSFRSFPNPFRTATTLCVPITALALSHSTAIRIFDVSGHLVRTLAFSASPGLRVSASSVRWDGRDDRGHAVPAGVYRCLSRAGSILLTKVD